MTPRTRSGNGDVDFKVYYSKKVPQQVHFPHKSKTVRRRTSPIRDGSGKRQLVFLPEKMKRQGTRRVVEDSDEDSEDVGLEEDLEDGNVSLSPQEDQEHGTARKRAREEKKRNSDMLQDDDSGNDEPVGSMNKRQRKASHPKNNRRSRRVQPDSKDENNGSVKLERTLTRQSTMTQITHGRNPLPGSERLDFKPVKLGPRLSWSGRGKTTQDQKQRTLTQMVPGIRSLEIMSDEDVEDMLSDVAAQEADSHTYRNAVARRLAQQGLYRSDHDDDEDVTADAEEEDVREDIQPTVKMEDKENENTVYSQDVPELVLQSVEDDDMDGDGEDSYNPTQFIDAPISRTRRTTRQRTAVPTAKMGQASYLPQKAVSSRKTRFSLLSTPEKRRVWEIPSSQSPAESPLSTQVTPQKFHRSPLGKCAGNQIQAPETPSKRKQVTFMMPSKTPVPPPTLRKFESTIQDSEDEDEEIIEEDLPLNGRRVGSNTQAMLDQIDQACANAREDGAAEAGSFQERDDSPAPRSLNGSSPELGEPQKQSSDRQQRPVSVEDSHHCTESTRIKQEPAEDVDEDDLTAIPTTRVHSPHKERPIGNDATTGAEAQLPTATEHLHSTPPIIQDTCPSTPMAILADSSDEETSPQPSPTPPQPSRQYIQHRPSSQIQQSIDLDGELIQVPRSPSPQHDETQQSHSSKAEQQLQNEWFSYSQYIHDARSPQSSSIRAAPDTSSCNATLHPLYTAMPQAHLHSGTHVASQATTIDEITQRTPRKSTRSHFASPHTTPHRIASSQPVISPVKPPPLFIPSSFPSPEKTVGEGWSSPLLGGMTQGAGAYTSSQWGASLEDFSIPPPPPALVKEEEEEE